MAGDADLGTPAFYDGWLAAENFSGFTLRKFSEHSER
jgi:hypothetical protein